MQVILVQDVANLGYKNDIVKVKDGYGRNYLIPNKLAIIANDSNVKQLNENLKQQAKKLAQQLADAQATAQKLAATVINVAVKANCGGDNTLGGYYTKLFWAKDNYYSLY